MDTVFRLLFYEMLGLGVIATVVKSFGWRDRVARVNPSAQGKLLRSPGETLQRESQALNDWVMGLLAGIASTPAIVLGQMPKMIGGVHIAIMSVGIVAWAIPLIYLLGRRRNLELRLRGERAVGEEVNRLMLEGCQVFHDFPVGPSRNIDHIIVAPSGVYAVETTTRPKGSGGKDRELSFDGGQLVFPGGVDGQSFEEARRNAGDLSTQLAAAIKEPVTVKAVLTVPGWLIHRTAKEDACVLNPDEIRRAVVTSDKPVLSAEKIQLIARQIEKKCRDVEL